MTTHISEAKRHHRLAIIPGDGIGVDVTASAERLLAHLADAHGFGIQAQHFDWGCDRFVSTGACMPEDGLDLLRAYDAVLLGAVGAPSVPDHVSLWGLLIPIRRSFDQFVNLRPIRLLNGITSPLGSAAPCDIDMVVVRENVEGEYSSVGGRIYQDQPHELAVQQAVFTRRGVERIVRYAFDYARGRSGRLTSATKSNGIVHTMPFWDEIVEDVASDYQDVAVRKVHIDALVADLVLHPDRHDVIVASNLFGDILSDLTAAIAGGIGIAPSANLNPGRTAPSMFEPVHGSAPDIAGRGIANPIGAYWTLSLLLEHLGEGEAAKAIMYAVECVVAGGTAVTPDLGGSATTADVEAAVLSVLEANA